MTATLNIIVKYLDHFLCPKCFINKVHVLHNHGLRQRQYFKLSFGLEMAAVVKTQNLHYKKYC